MLITRTGWTYEYVDRLCLRRAVRLLEYWRRESEAQLSAMRQAPGARPNFAEAAPEFTPPDEDSMLVQFQSAPRANPMQVGFDRNIERMPEHLRSMVDWAEEFKQKLGIDKDKVN